MSRGRPIGRPRGSCLSRYSQHELVGGGLPLRLHTTLYSACGLLLPAAAAARSQLLQLGPRGAAAAAAAHEPHLVHEGFEAVGLVRRQLCQDLAVHLDVLLLQAVHELRVLDLRRQRARGVVRCQASPLSRRGCRRTARLPATARPRRSPHSAECPPLSA